MALEIIRRNDGVLGASTLSEIRKVLGRPGLSVSTVHGWLKASSESDSDRRNEKKGEALPPLQAAAAEALDDVYEAVARQYLDQASKDEVVKATKGKDAIIAAATATDKMRLLRGLPTEIVGVTLALIEEIGVERASTAFQAMLNRVKGQADAGRQAQY